MKKFGLHSLKLVLAPLSNQEGEWLWEDPQVREIASESKLYMIGQRQELLFDNYGADSDQENFIFDLVCGTDRIDRVLLPLEQFKVPRGWNLVVEMGPKVIRILKTPAGRAGGTPELTHWFTPDRLLFYYWQDGVSVHNLEAFRKFTSFALYYVGISKRGDSFSRLFKTAHENRSRILGNESQIRPTARLTDELMIFLFKVEDLNLDVYTVEDIDAAAVGTGQPLPAELLVADAEKAFVRVMQSKYNTLTYHSYPKSADGLWNQGFTRYGFAVDEPISFTTPSTSMRGGKMFTDVAEDQADLIFIEGDEVTLLTVDDMKARLGRTVDNLGHE